MEDSQFQEAAAAVNVTVGFSAYQHGTGYSVDKFLEELEASVRYIKSQN